MLESGGSGECTLLIGSSGTLHSDLRRRFGAQIDAIVTTAELWKLQADPQYENIRNTLDLVLSGELSSLAQDANQLGVRGALEERVGRSQLCVNRAQYMQQRLNATRRSDSASSGSATTGNASAFTECFASLDAELDEYSTGVEQANQEVLGLAAIVATIETILGSVGLGGLVEGIRWAVPQLRHGGYVVENLVSQSDNVRLAILGTNSGGTDAQMYLLLQLLLLVFGAGTPPPVTLVYENRVASAELTAPFAGFGVVPTSSVNPTSLWESDSWESHGGYCLRSRSLIFLPPQTPGHEVFPLSAPRGRLVQRSPIRSSPGEGGVKGLPSSSSSCASPLRRR